MRKWVIGIALICLFSVITEVVIDATRPSRTDEERIVDTVLISNQPDVMNLVKGTQGKTYVLDEWMDPSTIEPSWKSNDENLFEKILDSKIKAIEESIKQFDNIRAGNKPRNEEVLDSDEKYWLKMRSSLSSLQDIKKSIGGAKPISTSQKLADIKKIRLDDRIELFPKSYWRGTYMSIAVPHSKPIDINGTTELAHPIYSKDRQYACLIACRHHAAFSMDFYFLERTRRNWRILVANSGVNSSIRFL